MIEGKTTPAGFYFLDFWNDGDQFNYRGQSLNPGKFFDLWLDNQLVASISYDPNRNDRTSTHHQFYMEKGKYVMQLYIMKEEFDRWGLGWLQFSELAPQ